MGNNSQQWTTMGNNPQCYMHLWCRFSDIAHSRYVSSNMGETLICPILVLTCDKFDPFKPKMEESVLFLSTGGTIDKCYPRTQVWFDADGHPEGATLLRWWRWLVMMRRGMRYNEENLSTEDDQDGDESGWLWCQGGYSFEFGEPAVGEVWSSYHPPIDRPIYS